MIFLRQATNRFEIAHRQIEADRASGKMPKRKVLPADYLRRRRGPPQPPRVPQPILGQDRDEAGAKYLMRRVLLFASGLAAA